jgi:hypothetical protein
MAKLEEAYGKEITEGRAAVYFENLQMYSIAEIEGAVNRAIREETFFPTVAMLINLIEEQREEKGERWSTIQLDYREEDRLSPEEARKGFEMIYKKIEEVIQKDSEKERIAKEEKKRRWEERKKKLLDQKAIVLGGV